MSVSFTLTTKTRVDEFKDTASINDAIVYEFDLTPWQEDNATIVSVDWALQSGNAAISDQALVAGVASALVTFNTRGRVIIALLISTATSVKKIWLEVRVKDIHMSMSDDYGFCS